MTNWPTTPERRALDLNEMTAEQRGQIWAKAFKTWEREEQAKRETPKPKRSKKS